MTIHFSLNLSFSITQTTRSLSLSLLSSNMALPKNSNSSSTKKKVSYISVPSQIINSLSSSSLQSLLVSPKKSSRCTNRFTYRNPRIWFLTLFLVSLFGMLKLGLNVDPISLPFSRHPCSTGSFDEHHAVSHLAFASENDTQSNSSSVYPKNETLPTEGDFWKQPDGLGFKPCLGFSRQYRKDSNSILKNRWKYLLVVVAGGLNQQRNQIVDAVIIARILGASLVVPVLQVNVIWGDERYI